MTEPQRPKELGAKWVLTASNLAGIMMLSALGVLQLVLHGNAFVEAVSLFFVISFYVFFSVFAILLFKKLRRTSDKIGTVLIIVLQGGIIGFTVIGTLANIAQHNYLIAAAFAGTGALLFASVKLIISGILTAMGATVWQETYKRIKGNRDKKPA